MKDGDSDDDELVRIVQPFSDNITAISFCNQEAIGSEVQQSARMKECQQTEIIQATLSLSKHVWNMGNESSKLDTTELLDKVL